MTPKTSTTHLYKTPEESIYDYDFALDEDMQLYFISSVGDFSNVQLTGKSYTLRSQI